MCLDLFSEETPCGSILKKRPPARKRPALSLCILDGRLREVRLYAESLCLKS